MKSFSDLPDIRDLRKLWKQEPVTPPKPLLELTPDSWVERGAEVVGWSLARLEYWLSGNGWLRAWLRLNLLISIVLTVAGVFLLPPFNRVLAQVADSGHWLAAIFGSVVGMITSLPPVIISIGVLYFAFVLYRKIQRKRLGTRERHPQEDYYE